LDEDHQNISVAWLPRSFDRLFHAFDIAWSTLLPVIIERGLSDDEARRQLANTVLLVAEDKRSAAEIAKVALKRFGV
jgi:hypothetical protein